MIRPINPGDPCIAYRIDTADLGDGRIMQSIDISGEIQRLFLDTREQQIRDVLIGLGWAPPPVGSPSPCTVHVEVNGNSLRSYGYAQHEEFTPTDMPESMKAQLRGMAEQYRRSTHV